MLLELHLHTRPRSSCSHLDPVDAVRLVLRKGLQGLVITEHHALWSEEELAALSRRVGVPRGFVLLAAQEVSSDRGHVLVYGARKAIPEGTSVEAIRRAWPAAALVLAHPWRHERQPSEVRLTDPLFDAVEILNSNHSARANVRALEDWHRLRFVAIAGSDAHAGDTVGRYPTLLDHPVTDVDGLAREIRAGRCRPMYKEIPRYGANQTVLEITAGVKGDDESRPRIVVRTFRPGRAWERAQEALATVRRLHDRGFDGGALRVPRVVEVSAEGRMVIEEGQRGRLLADLLGQVGDAAARDYLDLAARWLAEMHGLRLPGPGPGDAARRERRRLEGYVRAFETTGNPRLAEVRHLVDRVREAELHLLATRGQDLVQVHGDFHPRNVIIGHDRAQDPRTVFASVIDFDAAFSFLPAFDVGYFLAQFRHQLRDRPAVRDRHPREAFRDTWRRHLPGPEPADLVAQVDFFELRGGLSIAAYLVKVGRGQSPEMDDLLDRCLALAEGLGGWPHPPAPA